MTAQLTTAESILGKISGSEAALTAESDRQAAFVAMADATERFIQVEAASRLLRSAIDQYREKKQGPLLAAPALFSPKSLEALIKNSTSTEQAPPTLEGVRADGRLVGVSGLSTGTRDQLYLALRLAALELHLDLGHVMPFVAEDLFINFDNQRSEAGLRALAALSKKTQVLFLSHHDHLTEKVAEVLGEKVNIVRL